MLFIRTLKVKITKILIKYVTIPSVALFMVENTMAPLTRLQVTSLALSASALVSIAMHEGFRDKAYIPVPGDVPTIGFGTTQGVKPGDTITVDRALFRLLNDANKFEKAVQQCVTVPLYQSEFSAYVSLTYNIGEGAFCKSTLVKKLNTYDYEGACKEILRWDKFKGKPLPGLTKRRQQEYNMCIENHVK
jgi:lysozyme